MCPASCKLFCACEHRSEVNVNVENMECSRWPLQIWIDVPAEFEVLDVVSVSIGCSLRQVNKLWYSLKQVLFLFTLTSHLWMHSN